ncbi:MAG: hypothetical protein K0Q83_509 [Deltaproteobacteria bacterium]|nr:hypothetical protein [Deltaproteobacteria bacterium]
MTTKDPRELKFEEAIADLEQVVEQLESGEFSGGFRKRCGIGALLQSKIERSRKESGIAGKGQAGAIAVKSIWQRPGGLRVRPVSWNTAADPKLELL